MSITMRLIKTVFVLLLLHCGVSAQTIYLTRTGFMQWTIMQQKTSYNVMLKNNEAAFILDISSGQLAGQIPLRSFQFDETKMFTSESQRQKWGDAKGLAIGDFIKYSANVIDQFARASIYETTDAYPKLGLRIKNLNYSKNQSKYICVWDVGLHNKHKVYSSYIDINTTNAVVHISADFIIDPRDFGVNISDLNKVYVTTANNKIRVVLNADLSLKQ